MSTQEDGMASLAPYTFQTRNITTSENKAHTKEGAQAMGFKGSIVGGAIVYGQMIRPLVAHFGASYLEQSWAEVKFVGMAFDDDMVTSTTKPDVQEGTTRAFHVTAANEEGTTLIQMHTHLPSPMPPYHELVSMPANEWEGERQPVTWERMELHKSFRTLHWEPTLEEHLTYCDRTGEELPMYRQGNHPPLHPGLIMSQGSRVVANQFVLEFWIHAGSQITTRRMMRVGDHVEIRCIPIDKWQRGANEWVLFYQVYSVNGEPAMEVLKRSVFKVGKRG